MIQKRGFTLIEIMVVIAVIGVLATVVTVSVTNAYNKGKTAKIVTQFKEIEKAFIFTFLDEDRTTWWTEDELGLGGNPKLSEIIEIETGPLSTFSNYFDYSDLINEFTGSEYQYDNDGDEAEGCANQEWNDGVSLGINGIPVEQKEKIDFYYDGDDSPTCGRITYGTIWLWYKVSTGQGSF